MRILIVSSEVAPLAKTGGLADVAGSLPPILEQFGHEVAVCMPKYRAVTEGGFVTEPVGPITILIGSEPVDGAVEKTILPGSRVPVYLIAQDAYFNREGLYDVEGRGYPDNLARFSFFCRGVLRLLENSSWTPDIVHCNDWQTGLIPLLIKTEFNQHPKLANLKTLFTIHNLAYQGLFPAEQIAIAGIGWDQFHIDGVEFWGQISLLKGALVHADYLSTVSQAYSVEIQTEEFGCGLNGILRKRASRLCGIVNGVDYSKWNPELDTFIERNYSAETVSQGKAVNKKELIRQFGLNPECLSKPLIGVVARLAYQKGIDLLVEALPDLLKNDVALTILGTGEFNLEEALSRLARENSGVCGVRIAYDERMAHLIQAGADMFLMPSRYEPCGLTQLYSLKYGTVPIVRKTGGLADTIRDADENPDGNGFVFEESSVSALRDAVSRAVAAFRTTQRWNEIVRRGMAQDFSWTAAARAYEKLYRKILREAEM